MPFDHILFSLFCNFFFAVEMLGQLHSRWRNTWRIFCRLLC